MYYSDCHVHTFFSPDSKTHPREHIEQAIRLGMDSLCFTDHMDFDYPPQYQISFDLDPKAYFPYMQKLRDEYDGKLKIRTGVEIGLETACQQQISEYIQSNPWDFVIGSIHLSGRLDPYFADYFEGRTVRKAYRAYFESMLSCLEAFDPIFDTLGHLDYIFRCGDQSIADAWSEWPDLMDAILRLLLDKGIGLEVNTGGIKSGLTFQHPHDHLLARYRELGGELITLGSDAHSPDHLGDYFAQTGERLKALGFRYYAVFADRKPAFLAL